MIAYHHKSLDNLAIQEEAGLALHNQLITQGEAHAIVNAYPVNLYSPNFFIRIGFWLLTTVIILMVFGLLCLMLVDSSSGGFGILCLICAFGTYGGLELLIREKNHYCSGIDDAMIWLSTAFMVAAVNLLSDSVGLLGHSVLLFVLAAFYMLRFGNVLMACLAFMSFLGMVFYGLLPLGDPAKLVMPFLLMAISLGVYWLMKRYKHKHRVRHYTGCCTAIEVLALVVMYLAGNYFVVREVSNTMFGMHLKDGESIPGGWIFWIITVLIPAVYIFRGIQKRDAILLRTGLLLVAAIVFTVRYYYNVMPIEVAMTLGGAIMIGVAYGITKYLSPPKHGFTHAEPNDPTLGGLLQLEAVIAAETFGDPTPDAQQQFNFGGGSSGGGGASGEY